MKRRQATGSKRSDGFLPFVRSTFGAFMLLESSIVTNEIVNMICSNRDVLGAFTWEVQVLCKNNQYVCDVVMFKCCCCVYLGFEIMETSLFSNGGLTPIPYITCGGTKNTSSRLLDLIIYLTSSTWLEQNFRSSRAVKVPRARTIFLRHFSFENTHTKHCFR